MGLKQKNWERASVLTQRDHFNSKGLISDDVNERKSLETKQISHLAGVCKLQCNILMHESI